MSFVDYQSKLWQVVEEIVLDEGLSLYDLETDWEGTLKIVVETQENFPLRRNAAGDDSGEGNNLDNSLKGTDLVQVVPPNSVDEDFLRLATEAYSKKLALGQKTLQKQGVKSEACSKLCKRFAHFLLVEFRDLGFSNVPQIEVCSPGINRTLRLMPHFLSALFERVKLTLNKSGKIEVLSGLTKVEQLGDFKAIVGCLLHVQEDFLVILLEEKKAKQNNKKNLGVSFENSTYLKVRLGDLKQAKIDFNFVF